MRSLILHPHRVATLPTKHCPVEKGLLFRPLGTQNDDALVCCRWEFPEREVEVKAKTILGLEIQCL
jgi:hypothetical protein